MYSTAICTPACQHGGRCTRPDYCTCSTGFRGHRCEKGKTLINKPKVDWITGVHTAICTPQCENGGECVGPNQCRCPAHYSGSRCQDGKQASIYSSRLRVDNDPCIV